MTVGTEVSFIYEATKNGANSMKRLVTACAIAVTLGSQAALAAVCDYTPSNLIKNGGKPAAAGVAGATAATTGATVAATGAGMKAAGLYSITHASSGLAMLGSTAAGSSAAGTVGIIGGTAGFLGTAGAVLMSPLVIIPGAVAAVGVGVYEGGCYLARDKSEADE